MTTRRAIGSYAITATDEEKVRALYQAVEDAAFELLELGETVDELFDRYYAAVEDAETAA